jgi:hypothetical protein
LGLLLIERGDTAKGAEDVRKALVNFEGLAEMDPAHDLESLEAIAVTYSDMGQSFSKAASMPAIAAPPRMERWQDARSAYVKSLEMWNKIKLKAPAGEVTDQPQTLSQEISKCDAEIAKLHAPARSQ